MEDLFSITLSRHAKDIKTEFMRED